MKSLILSSMSMALLLSNPQMSADPVQWSQSIAHKGDNSSHIWIIATQKKSWEMTYCNFVSQSSIGDYHSKNRDNTVLVKVATTSVCKAPSQLQLMTLQHHSADAYHRLDKSRICTNMAFHVRTGPWVHKSVCPGKRKPSKLPYLVSCSIVLWDH